VAAWPLPLNSSKRDVFPGFRAGLATGQARPERGERLGLRRNDGDELDRNVLAAALDLIAAHEDLLGECSKP